MSKLEVLLKAWDENHWEFSLAFEGLSDEDLWRRAHPKLLSVGELAGHIAYWESLAVSGFPEPIVSPLFDKRFDYYTNEVDQPVVLTIGVNDVVSELKRIHELVKVEIARLEPDLEVPTLGRPDMTWGQYVQYQVFHVAYHCGQAYSVRHLMGHTTTDN